MVRVMGTISAFTANDGLGSSSRLKQKEKGHLNAKCEKQRQDVSGHRQYV